MSDSDDDSEKQHDPSQRRLDQARERGEIPRSAELQGAASLAGFIVAVSLLGSHLVRSGGTALMMLIGRPDELVQGSPANWPVQVEGMILTVLSPLSALFLAQIAALAAFLLATNGLVFAPERLMPKLSRISPMANLKHKFGTEGLFDFARNVLKLVAALGLFTLLMINSGPRLVAMMWQGPGQWPVEMAWLAIEYLTLALILTLMFGGADYLWQIYRHLVRNRMSRKDMQDEAKESDGDPHAKQERRRRGQEIAMNRMLTDVASADVVIVNPTHYAVALKWTRKRGSAPVCLAKGVDDVAARIRAKAAEAGIPLHSDPPTARLLYATIEIGQEINPEQYGAVAAAIRFSDQLRKRQKMWKK